MPDDLAKILSENPSLKAFSDEFKKSQEQQAIDGQHSVRMNENSEAFKELKKFMKPVDVPNNKTDLHSRIDTALDVLERAKVNKYIPEVHFVAQITILTDEDKEFIRENVMRDLKELYNVTAEVNGSKNVSA